MNLINSKEDKPLNLINILLSLISVVLFSMPWLQITSLTLFIALIPLLIINQRTTRKAFIWYSILTITLWHVITLLWLGNAIWIGVAAAAIIGDILYVIPLVLYRYFTKKRGVKIGYIILFLTWITSEYIYLNGEISFPWLILGNGFSLEPQIVQWYEYTGVFGGTAWVLMVNFFIFEALKTKKVRRFIDALSSFFIPLLLSIMIYSSYKEIPAPVQVAIIQPNINPYTDKFGGLSKEKQRAIIEELACLAPEKTTLFVAPETAIEGSIIINDLDNNATLNLLRENTIDYYPNSLFITGVTAYKMYDETSKKPTTTARPLNSNNGFYDIINGAVAIDSSKISLYIKSKLVIGVERVPYPKLLTPLVKFIDLGGTTGGLLTQKNRSIFEIDDTKVGSAICFESVYGEHYSGFVRNGANIMTVVTNDGWWDKTLGYKQHFNLSRLRAVETRRSIARSANTGISAMINQRGDVEESLGWDIRDAIFGTLNKNEKITFYTKYGDYIGRISSYALVLILLFFFSVYMKEKTHKSNK